jgi:hypothetical protein
MVGLPQTPRRLTKDAVRDGSFARSANWYALRGPMVELLQKNGDGDFLRAMAEAVLQILMEADVEGLIGAGRHERSAERLNYRNGCRERSLDKRLGSLQLRIPKRCPVVASSKRGSQRAMTARYPRWRVPKSPKYIV